MARAGAAEPMPEYVTLVIRAAWRRSTGRAARAMLERDVLPAYLRKRRWFAAKDQTLDSVRLARIGGRCRRRRRVVLAEIEVDVGEHGERYLLPLGHRLGGRGGHAAAAAARAGARAPRPRASGMLDRRVRDRRVRARPDRRAARARACDVRADPRCDFRADRHCDLARPAATRRIRWLSAEQSNSSLVIGDSVVLKLLRRLQPGMHPEAEMSALSDRGAATQSRRCSAKSSRVRPATGVHDARASCRLRPQPGRRVELRRSTICDRVGR